MSVKINDNVIALGRYVRGLAILWKKVYNSSVRFIESSLNRRILAVIFTSKSTIITRLALLMHVYH